MPFGRRNPFEEIEELLERMGREFDARDLPGASRVAIDVADHGDRYVVTADLPGFEKDDIDVRLAAGTVSLDAERVHEEADEDANYLRQERRRESVSRRVSLPDAVDEDEVSARYTNGVLTVELSKRDVDDGTSIDVE